MRTTALLLLGTHCRRHPRPSLLAKLAVGGFVAGSSLVRDHRRYLDRRRIATNGGVSFGIAMATRKDDDANAILWSTALDGMIDVPGANDVSSSEGVLYLSPVVPSNDTTYPTNADDVPSSPAPWPAIFADGGIAFSLTAHNPMGKNVPNEDNVIANMALERDIVNLVNSDFESGTVRPRAWWHSFGFHEMEGWREDGYTVSFDPENDDANADDDDDDDGDRRHVRNRRDLARDALLELAGKYRQAAIYEYTYESGILIREVVYVNPTERKARGNGIRDVMTIVAAPPSRSALSGRCLDGGT